MRHRPVAGAGKREKSDNKESQMALQIDSVLAEFGRDRSELIPALQAVQGKLGYLLPETFKRAGLHFNVPESTVYGVATFYAQFHLTRQGKHNIKVCRGTACHVRGSARIMSAVRKRLGIGPGETTPDYMFALERVACFGSCALAPVVVVDGKVHGRMTPEKALRIVEPLE